MPGFGATLRPVADQLIGLFGDAQRETMRRYARSGSASAAKTSEAVAETLTPLVVVIEFNIFEVDGWEFGDETLIISASEFTTENLDGRWTIERGGIERRISAIKPVHPGADPVYFRALIKKGARGAG